ncbi:hypothetical protein K432DRAFT_444804 [Lepidopterella palustris CBS 459.81]|uniref:Uncharacterized protein n=1 Tax=Lepidopterella palustris CBS 459.81 TaxID=1314670 RepID=A0A8E2E6Q3_9PEZI|nr:hypothetical protein K432DRAFT_444804 [Lepidopterella palustris CBS 459.81]
MTYANLKVTAIPTWRILLQALLFAGPSATHISIDVTQEPESLISGENDASISRDSRQDIPLNTLAQALRNTTANTTQRRYISPGPIATQPGDLACVFLGGPFPFVLRQVEEEFN